MLQRSLSKVDSGWGTMDGNDKSRNQSTHTYNESTAHDIRDRILNYYYDFLCLLKRK
jgi:hypothetical protein